MRKVTIEVWQEGERTMGRMTVVGDLPARELSDPAHKHFLHLCDFLERRPVPKVEPHRSLRWHQIDTLITRFGFCSVEALAAVAQASEEQARNCLYGYVHKGRLRRVRKDVYELLGAARPSEAAE